MKLLYLDCYMGAAGDMLMAALLSLLPEPEGYVERMNALLGGRAQVSCTKDEKCGISGLHVSVTVNGEEEDEHLHEHHHHHHHTGVGEICGMIDAMDIPDVVTLSLQPYSSCRRSTTSCMVYPARTICALISFRMLDFI